MFQKNDFRIIDVRESDELKNGIIRFHSDTIEVVYSKCKEKSLDQIRYRIY